MKRPGEDGGAREFKRPKVEVNTGFLIIEVYFPVHEWYQEFPDTQAVSDREA